MYMYIYLLIYVYVFPQRGALSRDETPRSCLEPTSRLAEYC